MAVSRQKVADDPLTMFMNNPDLENSHHAEQEIAAKAAPKAKPAAVPKATTAQSLPPVSKTTPESAPGFSQFTAGVAVSAAPAAAPKAPAAPVEDDEPMFGRETAAAAGDDIFQGVDINRKGKGSHLMRLGNEQMDDDELTDLNVNKLLEEETDLDYEMFGSSNVTMNGYAKPTKSAPKAAAPLDVLDDIDLNSGIIDLDIKEPDTNVFSSVMQYTAAAPAESAPETVTADFDINAYIKSQADDSGGLFD